MPKFVIERTIVGAGKLPRQELQAISQKSCGVLQSMGPTIQWVQSYVTDDKIYSSTSRLMRARCARTPRAGDFQPARSPGCDR
jgi:uncharacterized protein DUF4242